MRVDQNLNLSAWGLTEKRKCDGQAEPGRWADRFPNQPATLPTHGDNQHGQSHSTGADCHLANARLPAWVGSLLRHSQQATSSWLQNAEASLGREELRDTAKQNFAGKRVPKQSLGTRRGDGRER
jgi:hypothetical protein